MADETDNGGHAEDDKPFEVEFTPPSFVLKAKSPPTSRPLSEAMEKADAVVAELAEDYPRHARESIADLERAFETLPAEGNVQAPIDAMFAIAHDIRGQGGTFGFPLLTEISASLCSLLEDNDRVSDPLREAIGIHIASLKLVISEPIEGGGGKRGTELLKGLHSVSAVKG